MFNLLFAVLTDWLIRTDEEPSWFPFTPNLGAD